VHTIANGAAHPEKNMNSPSINTRAALRSSRVRPPELRVATFADFAQIADLAGRHDLPPGPFESWRRLWLENPAYFPSTPIGWVLQNRAEIVGFLGNIPLHYELDGQLVRTVSPRAWVVEESYRGYTLLLGDALVRQPNVDLILSSPGRGSPAMAAMGSKPIPQRLQSRSSFWITDPVGFSRAYVTSRKLRRALPSIFPHLMAAVLSVRNAWRGGRIAPASQRAELCSEFDARFDRFWQELRRQRRDVLLGRRDRAALDWHFGPALQQGKAILAVCDHDGHLSAYGIFLCADNPAVGLRRMLLVDAQQLHGSRSEFPAILAAALAECRRRKVHMVEVPASRLEETEIVREMAPHRRRVPPVATCFYKTSGRLETELREERRWDITAFDGDRSLTPDSMTTR
jgi:hypothetical protein